MEKKISGQTQDAGFQMGVRKTFNQPIELALAFLFSNEGGALWLDFDRLEELELQQDFLTNKGTHARITTFRAQSHIRLKWQAPHWPNPSILQMRIIPSKEKTTISFHQDHLLDSTQRTEMKQHWTQVLNAIGEYFSTTQSQVL